MYGSMEQHPQPYASSSCVPRSEHRAARAMGASVDFQREMSVRMWAAHVMNAPMVGSLRLVGIEQGLSKGC